MKNLFLVTSVALFLLAACAGSVSDFQAEKSTRAEVVIYMGPT
jgi:outer membrane biogenesis lipoprotein LolB